MKKIVMTDTDTEVIAFIEAFYLSNGTPPTAQEIVDHTRVKSTGHVNWIITRKLVPLGHVVRPIENSNRTFVPVKFHPERLLPGIKEKADDINE